LNFYPLLFDFVFLLIAFYE